MTEPTQPTKLPLFGNSPNLDVQFIVAEGGILTLIVTRTTRHIKHSTQLVMAPSGEIKLLKFTYNKDDLTSRIAKSGENQGFYNQTKAFYDSLVAAEPKVTAQGNLTATDQQALEKVVDTVMPLLVTNKTFEEQILAAVSPRR